MRGGTDRVPDIGIIIVSGHTSLRNADRRSNQSVGALGALVAQKRVCPGALLPVKSLGPICRDGSSPATGLSVGSLGEKKGAQIGAF